MTGGGDGALDAIDGLNLRDGDKALVFTSGNLYAYNLDDDSAAAESSPTTISPDSNAGDKRWVRTTICSSVANATTVTDAETVTTDTTVTAADNVEEATTVTTVTNATTVQSATTVTSSTTTNQYLGTFVNLASYSTIISTTAIDVAALVATTTWESFGPTGSGATNIWTALDAITADWIEISGYVRGYVAGGAANTACVVSVAARDYGSSEAQATNNVIAIVEAFTSAAGNAVATTKVSHKIKLDASKRFELYYAATAAWAAGVTASFWISGYGTNPA